MRARLETDKEKIWTVAQLISWSKDWLQSKGVESSRLNVELMLCRILNWQRLELYTRFDYPIDAQKLSLFKSWLKRRARREPLQYILGDVDFLGLNLLVNSSVLIPRPETEMMTQKIIADYSLLEPSKILDIGSGSGAISLALAFHFPKSEVLGIDISAKSVALASENARRNKILNVRFEEIDIKKEKPLPSEYNLIVSNPPYVSSNDLDSLEPELKNYEPKTALSDMGDGLSFYKLFSELFGSILAKNAKFYLEIGKGQEEEIVEMFDKNNFATKIHSDLFGVNRFIQGQRI